MKLGEIVRVARGVVTGNSKLFIMTRSEASERKLDRFVRPVLGGSSAFPKDGKPIVHDSPERKVVLIAGAHEISEFPALRSYLGDNAPRLATVRIAPIAVTYVGAPRFVANPDGLVITNALYTVTPRQSMSPKEILTLVERLNAGMKKLPQQRFAERYTPRSLEAIEI